MSLLPLEYFQDYKSQINLLDINFEESLKKNKKLLNLEYLLEISALFSSRIEGNSLDINSFMNAKNDTFKRNSKDFQEILDLKKAYSFAKTQFLNEKNFLKIHKILAKKFLIKEKLGKYRKESVGVFSSEGLVYLALEWEKVGQEMKSFFVEIENLLNSKLEILEIFYYASLIHLRFVHIHPFSDGNGRMARILEKWFLVKKLNSHLWFLQTEKYYFENRQEYYKSLNLGLNYYELDYKKSVNFLIMLPKCLN